MSTGLPTEYDNTSYTSSTSLGLTQSLSSKTDEYDISNESDLSADNESKLDYKFDTGYLSMVQCTKSSSAQEPAIWNFYLREQHQPVIGTKNSPNSFYVKCNSKTSGQINYDWAVWKNKKYKQCRDIKGYWKVLTNHKSTDKRIPINHLNCILSILRNKILTVFQNNQFNLKSKNDINFIFLNQEYVENDTHILHIYDHSDSEELDDIYMTNPDISAEYKLSFWNGYIFGATGISLVINKAIDPEIDNKQRYKKRESHFMYFPSSNNNINWAWYDNDDDEWKIYLDIDVKRSLEASYYGVQHNIFPLHRYKLPYDDEMSPFNYCSVPTLTRFVSKITNKTKPFVFRMRDEEILEVIPINNNYDRFATKIKRIIYKNDDEEEEPKSVEQESYSAFIVQKYIKYRIVPVLQSNNLLVPTDIILLCQKYYFQNVIGLQFAANDAKLI